MRTLFTFKFEVIFSFISNKNQGYKQENNKKTTENCHFLNFSYFFEKIFPYFL